MTAPVVKVTEVVGYLYDNGDGVTRIVVDEDNDIGMDALFPEEAEVQSVGRAWKGKRGRYRVIVEFTPDT